MKAAVIHINGGLMRDKYFINIILKNRKFRALKQMTTDQQKYGCKFVYLSG